MNEPDERKLPLPIRKSRDRLRRLRGNLEGGLNNLDRGYASISESDARFLMETIGAFLDGHQPSLDRAFGVKQGPGAPKQGPLWDETREVVKAAMFRGARSWQEISEETGRQPRDLQRLVARHGEKICDELAYELAEKMRERESLQKRTILNASEKTADGWFTLTKPLDELSRTIKIDEEKLEKLIYITWMQLYLRDRRSEDEDNHTGA